MEGILLHTRYVKTSKNVEMLIRPQIVQLVIQTTLEIND